MATQNPTLYLSSFFGEQDVVIDGSVPSDFNVISALVRRITENHIPGSDAELFTNAVLTRERAAPTLVGNGVALPHARIDGLSRPYMALGVYPKGLPSPEGDEPIRLVFLLLVPEQQPSRYLQILRALANLLQDHESVDRLVAMDDPDEIMNFIRRSEMRLPDYICAGDLMEEVTMLLPDTAPIGDALDAFMLQGKGEIPIVDAERKPVGVVDSRALLACFVPRGALRIFRNRTFSHDETMEALSARVRESHRQCVTTEMRTDFCSCTVDTPAREVAALLGDSNALKCYVTDRAGRLAGVIRLAGFFRRILKD